MSAGAFARLCALRDPGLEAVLWSLVPALGGPDHGVVGVGGLRVLADRLGRVPDDAPALQLDALGERVAASLRVPDDDRCELDDLRPDRALATGRADALVAAALTVAAGQRRGWDVDVVLGQEAVLVAHHAIDGPLVCSIRHEGHLLDATDLDDPHLLWADAHDVAGALLARFAVVAARGARPDLTLRARELAAALPACPPEQASRTVALARARALFN